MCDPLHQKLQVASLLDANALKAKAVGVLRMLRMLRAPFTLVLPRGGLLRCLMSITSRRRQLVV